MKNKLIDLNNYLFESIERLSDDDMDDSQMEKELKRASAVAKLSEQIISNAKVELEATKLVMEYGRNVNDPELPPMLSYGKTK